MDFASLSIALAPATKEIVTFPTGAFVAMPALCIPMYLSLKLFFSSFMDEALLNGFQYFTDLRYVNLNFLSF